MKRPLLLAAIALLVVSNAFVLVHVAMNRSGDPDSEMELTARELQYYGNRSDDSSVVLMLRWTNTAPEYPPVTQSDDPGWFDRKKLGELGFDLSVAADSPKASRFYGSLRSREAFVALEFDGPALKAWLKDREPRLETETSYGPKVSLEERIEIERQTTPRLVAIDVSLDAAALRRKYPDRKRVMILPAVVRAMLNMSVPASREAPPRAAYLRGAITRLAIESISVPEPISRRLDGQSYAPWTYDGNRTKINQPPYAVRLRVGSKYEPWVVDVKLLR
ncbi:MAG: DUF4824 family protein [Acidobacteriia bacterium]|nr:DUF4824 family protein [Terriglobia bacterium]